MAGRAPDRPTRLVLRPRAAGVHGSGEA